MSPPNQSKLKPGGVRRGLDFARHPAFYDRRVQGVLKTRRPGCAESKDAERFLLESGDPDLIWYLGRGVPWCEVAFNELSLAMECGTNEPEKITRCILADPEFTGALIAAVSRAMLYPSKDYAMAWAASRIPHSRDFQEKLRARYPNGIPDEVRFDPPVSRAEISEKTNSLCGGKKSEKEVEAIGPHLNRIKRRRDRIDAEWLSAAIAAGYYDARGCAKCGARRPLCVCAKWTPGEKVKLGKPNFADPVRGLRRLFTESFVQARDRVTKSPKKS